MCMEGRCKVVLERESTTVRGGGGLFLTGIGLTILCDITAISTDFQGHWDGLHAFCREKKVTEVPDVLG